jgi:ribonuclease Z
MPTLLVNGLTIEGVAESCHGSLVIVRNLRTAFDCGMLMGCHVNPLMRCKYVCVTHGHPDHIGALHMDAFLRSRKSGQTAQYLMPTCCVEPWTQAYRLLEDLNGESGMPLNITGVEGGEEVKRSDAFIIRALETIHRVPSVGYAVSQTRSKLLPELKGKTNDEIRTLKASGTPITYSLTSHPFAYTGDSTIEGIVQHDAFLTAEVLMMECTFVGGSVDSQTSKDRGHVHLDDIVAHQDKFQNKFIVLCHFSPRYHADQIREAVMDAPFTLKFRDKIKLFL